MQIKFTCMQSMSCVAARSAYKIRRREPVAERLSYLQCYQQWLCASFYLLFARLLSHASTDHVYCTRRH